MIIPAEVVGVYGTVHTPHGDIDTGPPERVVIDGAYITFHLPVDLGNLTRTIFETMTLHIGVENMVVTFNPPITIHAIDAPIRVVQTTYIGQITKAGVRLPEWVHR